LDGVRRQAAVFALILGIAVGADAARHRRRPPTQPAALAPRADPAALGRAYAAYRAGDLATARTVPLDGLANRDYALYVAGQAAALGGDPAAALPLFQRLTGVAGSRFHDIAAWRAADCLWDLGRRDEARAAYEKLVPAPTPPRAQTGDITDSPLDGDPAVGLQRIAIAYGDGPRAEAAWRRLAVEHPGHPLAATVPVALSARERIERAERLVDDRGWDRALEELALVTDGEPQEVRDLRDYWIATALYKMRRQYDRAGRLYIAIHTRMGARAADALFHGARSLSRADLDDEAIQVYAQVIAAYPSTEYAAEAQFLSGWLELNRGRFREALPALGATLARYGSSRWAADATWYLGLCHYLLGEPAAALPFFDKLAAQGVKGRYWRARALAALGRSDEARDELRKLVGAASFSWYALLARARLAEAGVEVGPYGDRAPQPAPALAEPDPALARDPLIVRADELLAAGMDVEAGLELHRGERAFLARYPSARAAATLIDRYDRAGNANRPWELADRHGSSLDQPPTSAEARYWWQHAYPRAYRGFIETYRALGANPPYYLYAIMRKESGYDPHVVSYADAIGLLQMIPATTQRVARALEMDYTDDLLYDSELNIKVGSWYIGHLLAKFKGQIPIGAGSFNCGPRPVMRWLEQNGTRPIDEFVELVAYTQTREYMKRVTEIYARYLYLYERQDYRQPLTVDADYVKDDGVDY
jgi:soluble lytic murein transglycosylase